MVISFYLGQVQMIRSPHVRAGWWVTIGGGETRPLLVHRQNIDTAQQQHIGLHITVTIQQRKMKWHQSFSSFHTAAHPSRPHFLFKMRKNKKQVCCCFCPFKLKTPWLGQSCRRSRSLSLSSATKIFVGTETRSENSIGFSSLPSEDALCRARESSHQLR